MMNKTGVFNTIFIEKISQKDKLNKTESDDQKTGLAPTLASWRQTPTLAPGLVPGAKAWGWTPVLILMRFRKSDKFTVLEDKII